MKFNIRKISAIGASVLMAGLTMGTAMAANYPAPFVSGGTANAAIVYGTGSGVSDLDQVAANAIQSDLGAELPATGTTSFSGGDVFTLEKDSDKFNFGEALNGVYTTVTSDQMEIFLADGTYDDGDIDEDYEQKITLGTNTLNYFADTDYNDKTPTIGFHFTNGQTILTYELEFDEAIVTNDMNETDLPLMGREYYVLSADANGITLLDTAETQTIAQGESVTVGGHVVEIGSITADYVKFTVDGVSLDRTYEDATDGDKYQELSDDSIIVLVSNLYDAKEAGISRAEFSLGSGKIDLMTGEEAELNDEDIDGLDVTLTGGIALTKIELTWTSDQDSFLTEANALILPTFETIKLGFGGLDFPSDPEEISIVNGDVLTIEGLWSGENLELMYHDADEVATHLGANVDNNLTLALGANVTELITVGGMNISNATLSNGMELVVGDRFLVTSLADDPTDVKTIYYEVTKNDYDGDLADFEVEITDLIGSGTKVFNDLNDIEELEGGEIAVHLSGINNSVAYFNFSASTGVISYNSAVSDSGLLITLPTVPTIADTDDTAHLNFTEMDREDDVGDGIMWSATIKLTDNDELHVASDNVTSHETSSDLYVGYVDSELATMTKIDKSDTEYDYDITYWGEEVSGDVYIASADAEVVSEGVASVMVVKDTEVSSVATKNLIVVGGSCINSAAAALVGGAYCGASWTTATGVGSGQFLIKSYTTSSLTSGMALLVAGYEKEDTTNAATYLRNKVNLDTSATYKGTSATSAELVVS